SLPDVRRHPSRHTSAFRSCHCRRRSPSLTYLNGGYRRSSLLYASASSVGIHRQTPCRRSSDRERLHGWSQLVHRHRYVVRYWLVSTATSGGGYPWFLDAG